MKRKTMTAAELLKSLDSNSEYQARVAEFERKIASKKVALAEDEKELLAECESKGVRIQSIWDLANTDFDYSEVIPVLIRHLSIEHLPCTIEGIARALTIPEACQAFDELERLFEDTIDSNSELKWVLGSALAETATPSKVERIVRLLREEKHGAGRRFLPLALVKLPRDEALLLLRSLPPSSNYDEYRGKAIRHLTRHQSKQENR